MSAHFTKLSVGCYAQNNCKNVSPKSLKISQNPYQNLNCIQNRFRYGFCNFSTPAPEDADFGIGSVLFSPRGVFAWDGRA